MASVITQEMIAVEPTSSNERVEQLIESVQDPVHVDCREQPNSTGTGVFNSERDKARPTHECVQCRKSFARRYNLERHINSVHCRAKGFQSGEAEVSGSEVRQSGPTFKNEEACDRLFSQENNIQSKIRSYECEVCQKKFYTMSQITRHIRVHTGEKPYQCEKCMKNFSEKSNLDKHRRVHNGEKPYQCEICLIKFSDKAGLCRHKLLHLGEKQFQCDICLKKYSGKCALVRHKLSHTGDKPYQCEICLTSFSRKFVLDEHKRIHTGEKPYQCEFCLKRFRRSCVLYKHKRIHTV